MTKNVKDGCITLCRSNPVNIAWVPDLGYTMAGHSTGSGKQLLLDHDQINRIQSCIMSRTAKYTDMGWPEQAALWKYDLLSEPLLSSELGRLAAAKSYHNTDCVTLQPSPNPEDSSQDRYVVLDWTLSNGTWQFRAVFDGHAGHDTVEHVVETLPGMVQSALTALLSKDNELIAEAVSQMLKDTITSLDDDLTMDVLKLFPDVDAISNLSDDNIRAIINDQESGGTNSKVVTRCMRGTTVLISLVDPQRCNLWMRVMEPMPALGIRQPDGRWETSILSSYHNGTDAAERERIKNEHPGESECIVDDRVLGAIAVTRAVGDHLFKLPAAYTERVFMNAKPGFNISRKIEEFLGRNITPPYVSNRADVRYVKLEEKETLLIMCSDGLLDLYQDKGMALHGLGDFWVQLLAQREKPWDDSNLALYLLRDALGGEDADLVSRMITVELTFRWMDDTTILVQKVY
ncbi:hypothetical protein D9615_002443 [Tricholomella constricta]|uniref:PPM-type phosphatase domain-containing protein n=1 Tax=Tricholomella constricta TaxID=117010 RepID=A0A8H5M9Z5_9AGAR|nr:hypothetical protein D9615_002443 [Tricholomella constricta]